MEMPLTPADFIRLFLNSLVLTAFMFSFFEKIYFRKERSRFVFLLSFIAVIIVFFIISSLGNPLLNVLKLFVLVNATAILLYRGKLFMLVFCNLCYILMGIFSDILSAVLLSGIFGSTINETVNNQVDMYIASIIGWIMLFFLCKLLTTFFVKEERTNLKLRELLFFFLITLLEFGVAIYVIFLIQDTSSGVVLSVFLIGFFCLNIYITFLIKESARSSQLKYELTMAQQQATMQLKHYKETLVEQEKAKQAIHDAQRHITTIEGLFASNAPEKAGEYTRLLSGKLDELVFDFECENQILGVIINTKLKEARTRGISFVPTVEYVKLGFMNDLDITVIFANLLDNAFEECVSLPLKKRVVNLTVKVRNNCLAIRVENPSGHSLIKQNGTYRSSKEGHQGIGLTNVQASSEKYNANVIVEKQGDNFVVEIVIPLSCKPI